MDFAFKNKVGVFLLGDEPEFFFSGEVDFAIDYLNFTPLVGIDPAFGGFAVEEGDEAGFCLFCESGCGEKCGEE